MNLLRPVLYAGGALVGVQLVNKARPINASAVVGAAGGGLGDFVSELKQGDFKDAFSALVGGAKAAGGNVEGQVKANVILGVLAGCAVAGVLDAILLS